MLKRTAACLLAAGLLGALGERASAANINCQPARTFNVVGASLQASINANVPHAPSTFAGDYCFLVNATETEPIILANYLPNNFHIYISSSGTGATFNYAGSTLAAFNIQTSSVVLYGLTIQAQSAGLVQWGVFSTSGTVELDTVTITNTGVPFTSGAVQIASTTLITNSVINAGGVVGVSVTDALDTIQFSTINATINSATVGAVDVNGPLARFDTIANSYVFNNGSGASGSNGLAIRNGAAAATVSLSTVGTQGAGAAATAMFIEAGAGPNNLISTSTILALGSPSGYGVQDSAGNNSIYGSTITTSGYWPLLLFSASNDVVSASVLSNLSALSGIGALELSGSANNNTIVASTMTAVFAPATGSVFFTGGGTFPSGNAIKASYLSAATGPGAQLQGGAFNQIVASTITGAAGVAGAALVLDGAPPNAAFGNRILGSVVLGLGGGDAIMLSSGASQNTIAQSTASLSDPAKAALRIVGASTNTISQLYAYNGGAGPGMVLINASSNVVTGSTAAVAGSAAALGLIGSWNNAFIGGIVRGGLGDAAEIGWSSSFNAIGVSTVAANVGGAYALNIATAALGNQVQSSFISNPAGSAAILQGYASQNTLANSTLVSGAVNAVGLIISAASTNTVIGGNITNSGNGQAVLVTSASSSTLSGVNIFGNTNSPLVLLTAASSGNVISNSYITNVFNGNAALQIDAGSQWNTVSFSTVTGSQGNPCAMGALMLGSPSGGATNNTLFNDYVAGANGNGLFVYQSPNNSISYSTITATGGGACGSGNGVYVGGGVGGANGNQFANDFFYGLNNGNAAFYFDSGAAGNVITQSTMIGTASGGNALSVANTGTSQTVTQSYLFAANAGASAVVMGCGGSGHAVSFSTMVYYGPNAAVITNDANTVLQNDLVLGGAGAGISLRGLCGGVSASGSQVLNSTVTTTGGGIGIQLANVANVNVIGDVVTASTDVLVSGSTNTMIMGDVLTAGSIVSGDAIAFGGGGATSNASAAVIIGSVTVNAAPASSISNPNYAILDNGLGPMTIEGYLVLRGTFQVTGGVAINEWNYNHVLGGGVYLGGATGWNSNGDSITLDGGNDVPPAPSQAVVFPNGATLGALVVNDPWIQFGGLVTLSATTFNDLKPGSTVTFFANASYNFTNFNVHGATTGAINLNMSPGTPPWNLAVTNSSVTLAQVVNSNASGKIVQANDGRVIDLGGNTNWGFLPQLVTVIPPQTWTDGVGLSAPVQAPVVAGAPFNIQVRAVSYSSGTVANAVANVTLTGTDPFQSPPNGHPLMTLPLVSGVTTFANVTVSSAEPSGNVETFNASGGGGALAASADFTAVSPGPLNRLQVIVPSEVPIAGQASGNGVANNPDVQIATRAIPSVIVRAVDAFNNLVPYISSSVAIVATNSSTATWQSAAQPLVGGTTVFTSTITFYSTGTFKFAVQDQTPPGLPNALSDPIVVSVLTLSSPTVALNVNMSTVTTLGGGLTGYAFDSAAVSKVIASVQNGASLKYYNFSTVGPGSFGSGAPVFATATLQGQGAYVNWSLALPDTVLADKTSYYVQMRAVDGSNNVTVAFASFTFMPSLLGVGITGQGGVGSLIPAISSGCEPSLLTLTYTVGAAGLQQNGQVVVTFPTGWTGPSAVGGSNPPPPGQGFLASSNGAALAAAFSSCQTGQLANAGASLCSVTAGATPFLSGDTISFVMSALPPIGPTGRGTQVFNVASAADGTTKPAGIASQPSMTLNPGTTGYFAFSDPTPLTLGSLQASATMQLQLVDLCGNPLFTNIMTTAAVTILAQNQFGVGLDTNAVVYATSPAGGVIVSTVAIGPGQSLSNAFYYQTSTTGVSFETIRATGMARGLTLQSYSEANRSVSMLVSSLTFSGISIDSGTVNPLQKVSTITYSGAATPAFIRFTPSVGGAPWSVLISSDPVAFSPPVYRSFGVTTASQPVNVAWSGLNALASPPQFVPASTYYVLLSGAFGAFQDKSLSVLIPQSPYIAGNLGAKGAGALVSISGPGAGFGNQGVATSTGYFQVFGLIDQQFYSVQASSAILVGGQPITLSTGVVGVQALAAGDLIPGTLTFPATAFMQVGVTLPQPAPYELSGAVKVYGSSGSPAGFGNLHFYPAAATSDNGAKAYGQAASTWTTMLVTPDTYTVVVSIPELRISTQLANVVVNPFATVGLPFLFQKKANVYGFVTIPSTTSFGAAVGVSAQLVGVSTPSVFASAFVQPWSNGLNYSSAPYALYGLDPGTWTITAKSVAFLSTATTVVISSGADVGDPTFMTSGLVLPLSTGGVIMGTVTINGDTTQASQCITVPNGLCPGGTFELAVQVYNQQTFQTAIVPIRVVKSPTQTSSTFTIAGLASGSYVVQTALGGWSLSPAGGQIVTVSTPVVATSSLTLNAANASTTLVIKLPPNPSGGCHPPSDAHNVGLWGPIFFGAGGRDMGYPDVVTSEVGNSTVTIYCSSMTVVIPPQNNGFETIRVTYLPTGNFAQQVLAPVQGAATTLNFDLSQPTVTVGGKVTFSGIATLAFSTYSVSVSTLGGILQVAPTNYFCLITATSAIPVSTLHLELIPLDPLSKGSVPPLRDYGFPFASGAIGCNPETAFGGVWGLMGYVAQIQQDGSFSFPGVSPGIYRLRNYANLDLNPARGAEIGFFETDVAITTNTNLVVPISQGVPISGLLALPPGMTTSRTFLLSLIDSHGNPVAQLPVTFNGGNAVPFTFTNVANGVYSIKALDYGSPYSFAARPVTVSVLGAPLSNQNIQLQPSGTIKASLAIQQTLSDGSKQFIPVTAANTSILPSNLLVAAVAAPWVQGGYYRAQSVNCSSPLVCFGANPGPMTIDPNTNQMQIIGVLPGTYNVEFIVPPGVSAGSTGGLSLVSTVRSGVTVGPGQTVDLGVVGLSGGTALSGKVVDVSNSAPLVGVRLLARPSIVQSGQVNARSGFQLAYTDQNGNYTFPSLDPAVRFYDIFAANRGAAQQGDPFTPYEQKLASLVDIQSTATLNFALTYAPYSVSGQVVGQPGDQLVSGVGQGQGAVPGATILMQKVGVTPTLNPIADIVFQTDAQGNFTVPALTAGQYVLYAMALNYGTYSAGVTITTGPVGLGTITLGQGATLAGSLRRTDGMAPSEDDVQTVVAAATDLSDFFFGRLTRDPHTRGVTGYALSGFRPGTHYRVLFVSIDHELAVPPEASDVVFASSAEARGLDVTFTPKKPFVGAKASTGPNGAIKIALHSSQPLRERFLTDDNFSAMVTTSGALGFISSVTLSVDRRELTALYTPGVNESSFTLKLQAYSAVKDPSGTDPINPEFVIFSTPTFYMGTDAATNLNVNNVEGGGLAMEGDQARITMPKGAFSVDVSSGLSVVFQKSHDKLAAAKLAGKAVPTVEANIRALRYPAAAYPSSLFQAMASLPPQVSPFSAFYDVLLPLGVRTALAQPVTMTVSYDTATVIDPSTLNLYWFNAAANAYVLQQDVTGAAPLIDPVNHTITIHVNHFSTFVLFNTGVNVITGAAFPGSDITAYNFPNPFDLSTKQVSTIHGGGTPSVRGTMITIGLPPDVSGDGTIRIFNVAGEKVRSIDLGSLSGGAYYYQAWDGRSDSGRDVASGVYIGQVKVGSKSKFFKMALIK